MIKIDGEVYSQFGCINENYWTTNFYAFFTFLWTYPEKYNLDRNMFHSPNVIINALF